MCLLAVCMGEDNATHEMRQYLSPKEMRIGERKREEGEDDRIQKLLECCRCRSEQKTGIFHSTSSRKVPQATSPLDGFSLC